MRHWERLPSVRWRNNGFIMLTCPCNVDTPSNNFYIVKLGLQGYTFFLTFALKRRLWVLVRTAWLRQLLRVPTICVLSKQKGKIPKNELNIVSFTTIKIRSILHMGPLFRHTVYEKIIKPNFWVVRIPSF